MHEAKNEIVSKKCKKRRGEKTVCVKASRTVANPRIGLVNDLDYFWSKERIDVIVDLEKLHTCVAEYQIRMFFERLEKRKVRISLK